MKGKTRQDGRGPGPGRVERDCKSVDAGPGAPGPVNDDA